MDIVYQYLVLDGDIDKLIGDNLRYDLPSRYENNESPEEKGEKESDYSFNTEDIRYVVSLVLQIIDHYDGYREKLEGKLQNWSYDRVGNVEKSLIYMAYAEFDLNTAPYKTVIDEAIELSKIYCDADAYKFINGILDSDE